MLGRVNNEETITSSLDEGRLFCFCPERQRERGQLHSDFIQMVIENDRVHHHDDDYHHLCASEQKANNSHKVDCCEAIIVVVVVVAVEAFARSHLCAMCPFRIRRIDNKS